MESAVCKRSGAHLRNSRELTTHQLYQVIFSSVVAFTALLSVVFLGKRLARLQWVGVALVSIGLACSTLSTAPQEPIDSSALARLASHSFASNRESTPDNDASAFNRFCVHVSLGTVATR